MTGLLAGWGTVATGVNLASMLIDYGVVPRRLTTPLGVATLASLGAAVIATTRTTGTRPIAARSYLATILGSLGGVVAGQRGTSPTVSATAAAVALAVVADAVREHQASGNTQVGVMRTSPAPP